MPATYKLYSFWTSSCSFRVRIALAYKGLRYEYIPVDIGSGEHKMTAFKAMNPAQVVPFFVATDGAGEFSCSESAAIIEFLDETAPGPKLLPGDAAARARIREISAQVCCGIQPLQNLGALKLVKERYGRAEAQPWAQHWIRHGLAAVEARLAETSGRYCVGDQLSMADCCLAPQVLNATDKFDVPLDDFPTVASVSKSIFEHPAVKAAHPACQPDTPPLMRRVL
ncbi:putative maleylacetoacetate isomerase 2 [Diplonema papillatum]|nr:putative maleylacetoacetate isomerase 2 [Diplonema papillatum]